MRKSIVCNNCVCSFTEIEQALNPWKTAKHLEGSGVHCASADIPAATAVRMDSVKLIMEFERELVSYFALVFKMIQNKVTFQ